MQPQTRSIVSAVNMAGCLTNIFGFETASGPKVDWSAGEKRQKKTIGIEPSDSEGVGGN